MYTDSSRAREKNYGYPIRRREGASPLSGIVHEENKCSAIKDLAVRATAAPTCNDLPRQVRRVLSRDFHYSRLATRVLTAKKYGIHRAARDDETRYASR